MAAIRAADWPALGALLDASHHSLRDDFEVSCPELDLAVTTAREAGALGARLTGGGFGGSVVSLVPEERAGCPDHGPRRRVRRGWVGHAHAPDRDTLRRGDGG